MSKNPRKKKEIEVKVIKTPEGQIPTIESFHSVVDGLFGEILDTRKDVAKLIPNLEKELKNLKEILAQQMVLFEIMNSNIQKLEKEMKTHSRKITQLENSMADDQNIRKAEADLTAEAKKAISKLIKSELVLATKPLYASIKQIESNVTKSKDETIMKVEKILDVIKDQIDDVSSKTELQMLEILESLNVDARPKAKTTSTSTKAKKKLTS
ncbi:MAG: hypothetical protein ACTSO7_00760 [Candidatus Heimdallarchaeota archaeon]